MTDQVAEVLRTQGEIVEHCRMGPDRDWLGTIRGDLLEYVDAEAVREFCDPDVDLSDHVAKPLAREGVLEEMRDYMEFAIGKAADHRGISAGRSLEHYRAWTWLLGEQGEIDWKRHENYGAPVLKQLCGRYGFPFPDDAGIQNMAKGEPCCADCENGCGS